MGPHPRENFQQPRASSYCIVTLLPVPTRAPVYCVHILAACKLSLLRDSVCVLGMWCLQGPSHLVGERKPVHQFVTWDGNWPVLSRGTAKALWGPKEEKIPCRWDFKEGFLEEKAFAQSFRNGEMWSGNPVEGSAWGKTRWGGGKVEIAEFHFAASCAPGAFCWHLLLCLRVSVPLTSRASLTWAPVRTNSALTCCPDG